MVSATDLHKSHKVFCSDFYGFVFGFVFVFLFLCFFLVCFELYCISFCLWELTHCWLCFICILAMMSEMYQVHQLVFLNLSLSLNLKTIYSTQVQTFIFRQRLLLGPEYLTHWAGYSGGRGVSAFGPESPPPVVFAHIKGDRAEGSQQFPHSAPDFLSPQRLL